MPGWLVVTCVGGGGGASLDEPAGAAREDYAACCCAVQNLCLSLHADGLGTKWTTGAVNFDARFGAAAGLPTDGVVGTLWFGRAATTPPPPAKRLGVEEVLRRHYGGGYLAMKARCMPSLAEVTRGVSRNFVRADVVQGQVSVMTSTTTTRQLNASSVSGSKHGSRWKPLLPALTPPAGLQAKVFVTQP